MRRRCSSSGVLDPPRPQGRRTRSWSAPRRCFGSRGPPVVAAVLGFILARRRLSGTTHGHGAVSRWLAPLDAGRRGGRRRTARPCRPDATSSVLAAPYSPDQAGAAAQRRPCCLLAVPLTVVAGLLLPPRPAPPASRGCCRPLAFTAAVLGAASAGSTRGHAAVAIGARLGRRRRGELHALGDVRCRPGAVRRRSATPSSSSQAALVMRRSATPAWRLDGAMGSPSQPGSGQNMTDTGDRAARGLAAVSGNHACSTSSGLELMPGVVGLLGPNGAGKTDAAPDPRDGAWRRPRQSVAHPRPRPRRRDRSAPRSAGGSATSRRSSGTRAASLPYRLRRLHGGAQGARGARRSAAREVRRVLERRRPRPTARPSRIRTLSGGQRRRVGLAQALLGSPELLVLDEPTTGLDPEQRVALRQVLAERGRVGRRCVIATHQTEDVAALCERRRSCSIEGSVRFHGTVARARRRRARTGSGSPTSPDPACAGRLAYRDRPLPQPWRPLRPGAAAGRAHARGRLPPPSAARPSPRQRRWRHEHGEGCAAAARCRPPARALGDPARRGSRRSASLGIRCSSTGFVHSPHLRAAARTAQWSSIIGFVPVVLRRQSSGSSVAARLTASTRRCRGRSSDAAPVSETDPHGRPLRWRAWCRPRPAWSSRCSSRS